MSNRRPRWPVAVAAATCLPSAACSSNTKAAPSATTALGATTAEGRASSASTGGGGGKAASSVDPCSLLTDAEAGVSLGGPASHKSEASRDATAVSGMTVTENKCRYDLITSDQLGHEVWIAAYAGADRNYFNQTSHATSDASAIPGLGDAATGTSHDFYVFSKGVMLQIYGSSTDPNVLQHIASVAISKL
jgi:hypothetical protein